MGLLSIVWISESSICRHTLFFVWLALFIGLYKGTAQRGDQNCHGMLHRFSLMVQKEKGHRLPPEAVYVRCMMES